MKKIKIIATLVLTMVFSISVIAASEEAIAAASDLYKAGLMKGNSDIFSVEALELDRPATRVETAITITRMLGKETKALYQQNPHPFNDVPDWASAHVGWLYENYLVNGVSDTVFGSSDIATTRQFCTMLLRVLGYSDSKGDFSYNTAVETAQMVGLVTPEEASIDVLYRSNMALISRRALSLSLKNAYRTLSQKLREDRAITAGQYDLLNPEKQSALDSFFTAYPENVANGRAYYYDNKIVIRMEENIGSYGLRVFYTSDSNPTPIELPIENNSLGFVKGIEPSPFEWYKYVTTFNIYGLSGQTNVKFKIVNSSSETALYQINGVSPTIETKYEDEWTPYIVSLTDFSKNYPVNVSTGVIRRGGANVTVRFNSPVSYYGLRVVYTSDQTTYPKELPIENTVYGFKKGEPDYTRGGKIHEITLYGLKNETNIKLCVIESSSEADIYNFITYGFSPVIKER